MVQIAQYTIDSGSTKNIMSKQYYLRNTSLHGLPKLNSKVIQVGNEISVTILFIIPIIITIHGHMSYSLSYGL